MRHRIPVIILCTVLVAAAFLAGFVVARNEGVASAANGDKPAAAPAPPPAGPPPAGPPPQPGGIAPQPGPTQPVPQPRLPANVMRERMRFAPATVTASGNYVYVVFDATLHQFQAEGLKLVKKVPLFEESKEDENQ